MTSSSTRLTPLLLLLVALVAVARVATAAAPAPPAHACSDPCFQAARAGFRECASGAKAAFQDALDGCLDRDPTCVDACRSRRQGCRNGTVAGAALPACDVNLEAEKEECRNKFAIGSEKRENCIDRAQVDAFRCRTGVRRSFRQALLDCDLEFQQCAAACGPGGPPEGAGTCKAEGKAAFQADLASCKLTFQVTASACFNKDVTCVQGCADARDTCGAPTQATLDAALAACTAQEKADLAACQAANPGGGPALDQCVTTAQANAFTCRDTALEASAPGFATCAEQYLGCVEACPPA